jgi:c-di-GMP-binding flagellar brake protein YcgR
LNRGQSGGVAMDEAEKLIGLAAYEMERRGMPRCPVNEEAALLLLSQGRTIRGRMLELSAGGCRLALGEKLPLGTQAAVEVSFRIRGFAFRLSGLTEWTSGRGTVGVSFAPMSARRRDDLMEALCETEAEVAAKAKAAAEGNGAPEPAEETECAGAEPAPVSAEGKGFRLLNVVFRRVDEAGAATGDSAPAGVGGKAPSRRERRVQARCDVDTSAIIHLVKIGSRLAGQIRDLSPAGCRIHATERFPVGIYTRVEVEFRLQGTPLLLGGVVQAIHGRNDVGIRFLEVSARKREQLTELIGEIKEMRESGGSA